MTRPHIEPFVELNEDFKPFKIPGFVGANFKVLSLDTDNGACTLKVRLDGGFKRKPGISYSDQEIFVLEGGMTIDGQYVCEGHYIFLPAGMAMGAIDVPQGCEALFMFNDGEPTFEESDTHHPLTLKEGYVSLNSYEDAPWSGGSIVSPSVATGCMIKLLHFDPMTEAMTFLYCMTPQFMQDNISYHDCAEESYHIWGSSWMLQFGDLPTGGYFWRPPYINHGSFRSKLGCIAIGRTDSKLHNYFHFNPWTNPDENQSRAAAFLYRQRPQMFRWVNAGGHNHPHGPQGQAEYVAPTAPDDFENPDYVDDAQVKMLGEQRYTFREMDEYHDCYGMKDAHAEAHANGHAHSHGGDDDHSH